MGIATTSPGTKLDVSGRTRTTEFQLGTSATAGHVLTTDVNGVGTWQAVSALPSGTTGQTLRHNGTTWAANSVIYNDGSNVGVGATSFGTSAQKVLGIGVGTTPASSPADMVQLYAGDVADSYTKLLLHGDGTDGSTSFPDASASNHTVTVNSDAQVDTAQKKFGTGSLLCNTTGDNLTIDTHSDFNFSASNFTIDLWVLFTDFTSYQMIVGGSVDHVYWLQAPDDKFPDLRLRLYLSSNGSSWDIATVAGTKNNFVENTWYHIAFTWDGTTYRVFVDGVLDISVTSSTGLYGTTGIVFGGSPYWETPYIQEDEIRVSKGIARWTSNFTPPSSPYTVEAKAELKVLDEGGNETQLSPHDPVTGEWIFDSYNIKTGKYYKVNMEKLVETLENLSGVQLHQEGYLQP